MTHEEFLTDWKERYIKGACTVDHLQRLKNIGKLSEAEMASITSAKKDVNK